MPKPTDPSNTQIPDRTTQPGADEVRRGVEDRSTNGLMRNPGELCRGQGPSEASYVAPLMPARSPQTLTEGVRAEGAATLPSGERPKLRAQSGWRALDEPPASGLVISHISAQKTRREITLEVGQRDIRIRRSQKFPGYVRKGGGVRLAVTGFSNASRRRLLFTARNFPGLTIMLTLTYPANFPMDGRLVKNHWRRFRQWMIRNGAVTGLWVLEFQKRGAPHFHVFIREPLDRQAVSDAWYRVVGSNDPRHHGAGTRIELFRNPPALGSYVMKYAAKMEQKDVPDGFGSVGRFWGTWGNPEITRTVCVPQVVGKHFVRTIRKAHIKARRNWTSHKRFRDNGRSGFIAWETSTVVKRVLDDFLEDGLMHPT